MQYVGRGSLIKRGNVSSVDLKLCLCETCHCVWAYYWCTVRCSVLRERDNGASVLRLNKVGTSEMSLPNCHACVSASERYKLCCCMAWKDCNRACSVVPFHHICRTLEIPFLLLLQGTSRQREVLTCSHLHWVWMVQTTLQTRQGKMYNFPWKDDKAVFNWVDWMVKEHASWHAKSH